MDHCINVDLHHTPERWFALRVKSRCEKVVSMMAQHKGLEEFLPLYQSRRRWSDRLKSVELPLFPGYLFCRLDPQHRLPLLMIPGVLHFVGVGKVPVPIADGEIAALQTAVRSGLLTEPHPFLEIGQRVRLDDGPLAGLEGILVGTSKQQRIVVSVTMLKRSVAVAIERHWVTPLSGSGRPLAMKLRPFLTESSPADAGGMGAGSRSTPRPDTLAGHFEVCQQPFGKQPQRTSQRSESERVSLC